MEDPWFTKRTLRTMPARENLQARTCSVKERCYVVCVRSLALAMLVALAACAAEKTTAHGGPLDHSFETSAASAGVPRDLLLAIAVVEDGLEVPPRPDAREEAEIAAAGPLQLRRGKLD